MTETALVLHRGELAERSTFEVMPLAFELANKLATTEFVPVALRNKPAAIAAAILQGHEVGIPPMASLAHVHVIEGRPSLSAAIQRALILAHGHEIWIEEQTMTRAVVCGRRKGEDRVMTVTWTLDDAKRAQLMSKQNWQKYPRNMLVARATGDVARGLFMDVLGGMAYNAEELGDGVIEGEVVDANDGSSETPAPEPQRRTRRASRAATAPAEPPSEPVSPDPEPAAEVIQGEVVAAGEPEIPEPEPEAQQPLPGEKAPGEHLTLAQQVAIVCLRIGIDRKDLLFAVTGKTSGREITRDQAVEVLETAKAIERGEKRLVQVDNAWAVLDVTEEPAPAPEEDEWS